jgi:hypothetical protein
MNLKFSTKLFVICVAEIFLLTTCVEAGGRVIDPSGVLPGFIKFREIPALKLDGLTLITESKKADAIASKFTLAHDNTLRSELSTLVQNSCSRSQ